MSRGPDILIAGGGLAGCLAALALAERRPDVSFLLVEGGASFGGNHIWSFFDSDVDEDAEAIVRPLVARRWDRYDILFPRRRRTLPAGYNAVTSDLLDAHVRATLRPDQYRLGTRIEALAPTHVTLAGGERIEASGVIDARGAA
ncbi:MAG TPA: lycopene cyclase family protein, partial [Allosphingosinicella sp.]